MLTSEVNFTQVEDLFYNVPSRRNAFRSPSEEYAKILDLVGRYAVHCVGVGFSCKKHGDANVSLSVPAHGSQIDRIRQVHGASVARELIEMKIVNNSYGFKATLFVSNANYSMKRMAFLLFINHRSVESSTIKKALEQTYAVFLPKGGHPFVYLSLEIEPQRVDVNIHPTKREVGFLNEEEIISQICEEVQRELGKVDNSRTFMTQALLAEPNPSTLSTAATPKVPFLTARDMIDTGPGAQGISTSIKRKIYENDLVRTDNKERKITSMLLGSGSSSTRIKPIHQGAEYKIVDKQATICRLSSIKELRADIRSNFHEELADTFASHTFIGVVDTNRRIAAIQSGVKLFLVDYGLVCNAFFYQLGLTDFGNFGVIQFDPPLDLKELLQLAIEKEMENVPPEEANDLDWDNILENIYKQLLSTKEMLTEYFSIIISEDGKLESIPLLIKGYTPAMSKLATFLLRLGPHVDWTSEKECFRTFLREVANFYVPECLPNKQFRSSGNEDVPVEGMSEVMTEDDQDINTRRMQITHALEDVLFPAFKNRLVATSDLLPAVVEVANLRGLYRVFERC
jgi:DNA mismatch repair protein MLH1